MRKIIFSGLLLVALVSCQNDDSEPTNEPVNVEFTTVEKGDYLNPYTVPSGNFVVNTQEELDALNSTYIEHSQVAFPSASVDFSTKTLIMAIDEHHANSGYYLDIVSITKYSDHIVVDVNKTVNTEEEILTMESQPYHLVTIPKTTLPVTFQ